MRNRFVIALSSLRNSFRDWVEIAAQSLHNQCAIATQSDRYRRVIAARSIAAQSLPYRWAIANVTYVSNFTYDRIKRSLVLQSSAAILHNNIDIVIA
jgi:hypothetical protein